MDWLAALTGVALFSVAVASARSEETAGIPGKTAAVHNTCSCTAGGHQLSW
jgi:hypothetical protein